MAVMKNIYLVGPMAAGKSTIGKELAKLFAYDWIDTDQEIVARTGVELNWIFEQEGEAGFRARESKLVAELVQRDQIVISTGAGTVLDPKNRDKLKETGLVIYLKVSLRKQLQRTEKDKKRPLLQSEDKEARLRELAEQRNVIYADMADLEIATDSNRVEFILEQLVAQIKAYGA